MTIGGLVRKIFIWDEYERLSAYRLSPDFVSDLKDPKEKAAAPAAQALLRGSIEAAKPVCKWLKAEQKETAAFYEEAVMYRGAFIPISSDLPIFSVNPVVSLAAAMASPENALPVRKEPRRSTEYRGLLMTGRRPVLLERLISHSKAVFHHSNPIEVAGRVEIEFKDSGKNREAGEAVAKLIPRPVP